MYNTIVHKVRGYRTEAYNQQSGSSILYTAKLHVRNYMYTQMLHANTTVCIRVESC